jgi:hypothetical protein
MRKLIVANIMSLDGYFEGPGGSVMALPMDDFFDAHNLERLRAADTLLLGATTYMGLKGHWPAVAADPGVSPAVAANPRRPTLSVPKTRPRHATRAYSWIRPPRRSSRTTRTSGAGAGSGMAPSGGAWSRERCGRCPL